jgi:GTP-binding protein EngB required for normal cell division
MNANHRRHLLATFRHIDGLLSETARIVAGDDSTAVFSEYTQDTAPIQRKVIGDYIQRTRELMRRSMQDFSLTPSRPVCGALWAARTRIGAAQVSVSELDARHMAAYGTLSDDDATLVDSFVGELRGALDQLGSYIAQGSNADLSVRLHEFEQTHGEMPVLRELTRIITDQGLVSLRESLTMLLDRVRDRSFEIGVFGRTSSGKSSLLNYLLGAAILPVGVTPVTAVPTRVQFGRVPRVTVEFARDPKIVVDLARLADFSTEQHNPANRKHVTRIVVEVPSPWLREGITWVDTPGLGSLATNGAAETAAYLPRCDLGVVLIDAGGTLSEQDLLLAQALLRAGAHTMLLISKADLLEPLERQRFVAYVREQCVSQLGTAPPLHPVSVMGEATSLCDEWSRQVLRPLLVHHRAEAAAALKRKVGLLREATIGSLEGRLPRTVDATAASDPAITSALGGIRGADTLCAAAERATAALIDASRRLQDAIIESAATDLAALWRGKQEVENATVRACDAALERMLSLLMADLSRSLEALRQQLEDRLRTARQALAMADAGLDRVPRAAGGPLFDATATTRALQLHPPALSGMLPKALLLTIARSQLRAQWRASLQEFLDEYRGNLHRWLRQAVAAALGDFRALAAPLLTQLEMHTQAPTAANRSDFEADLRRLRELSPATPPPSTLATAL